MAGRQLGLPVLVCARVAPARMLCSCSSVQESRSTDLTLLICVPMPRWMPEQRMQTNTPRFQLAHLGSVGAPSQCPERLGVRNGSNTRLFLLQSAQTLFASNFRRLFIVCWFCAARSAAGFGGLRDILESCVGGLSETRPQRVRRKHREPGRRLSTWSSSCCCVRSKRWEFDRLMWIEVLNANCRRLVERLGRVEFGRR